MKLALSDSAKKILFLLIATDFIYICFHIFYKCLEHGFFSLGDKVNINQLFLLYNDRSYPEFFQYTKE